MLALFLSMTSGFVLFEMARIGGWRIRATPKARVGRAFGAVRLVASLGAVPGAILGGYLAMAHAAVLRLDQTQTPPITSDPEATAGAARA